METSDRIEAIVLAGGLGTRLRPVLRDRPKVLADFNGRPFLAYVLDALAQAGVARSVISTGYLGPMVRDAIGDAHAGMPVAYVEETQPMGTGGAVRLAAARCEGDPVLCLNGDSLCVWDLPSLLGAHRARGAAATLLSVRVPDISRYGALEVDGDGGVTGFAEKGESGGEGIINAGVYALSRALLASIPEGVAVSLEREVFPRWIGRGLCAHAGDGAFLDIGTPEDHARGEAFLRARGGS